MIIHVHDNLKLSDIQERFSKCFPSLKIEFYNKRHTLKKSSSENFQINPSKHVGEIRHNHSAIEMELKSWFTVARVEKDFREKFGLNVQVFRREMGHGCKLVIQTSLHCMNNRKWQVMQQLQFTLSTVSN